MELVSRTILLAMYLLQLFHMTKSRLSLTHGPCVLGIKGKTTTMGILTGDATPTSGEAYVASHDVTGLTKDGVQLARKNIGFCPQVDPLLDLMTGRETLAMFGRLRGIPTGMLVR